MSRLARRACALLAVLTVLVAGAVPTASRRPCPVCPRDCPMHAGGVGCHHGSRPRCHHAAGLLGVRAACGHGDESAGSDAGPLRSVLPERIVLDAALAPSRLVLATPVAAAAVPLEPPTEPPRAVPA